MNYTTTVNYGTYGPYPEAFVSKGKNRLRQNGNNVYLSDNDEFEVELNNPTTSNVLAKIKLNGSYISTRGIVIKPGQRIHLDRFIDDSKKFKFSTYNVDGSDSMTRAAIAYNGDVQVEFYHENNINSFVSNINTFKHTNTYTPRLNFHTNVLTDGLQYNGSGKISPLYSYPSSNSSYVPDVHIDNSSTVYTKSYFSTNGIGYSSSNVNSRSIETGRVEKGSESNTKLQNVNMDFNSYAFHTVNWKILPQSQEPIQASDIKNYCGGCGYRVRKSTYNFCPKCGNKL
jgi:hypothetical protein